MSYGFTRNGFMLVMLLFFYLKRGESNKCFSVPVFVPFDSNAWTASRRRKLAGQNT
jgi:hypothetical protein